MRVRLPTCLVSFCLGSALFFSGTGLHAQTRNSLKSGEGAELGLVCFVVNCASIVVGNPDVEVLVAAGKAANLGGERPLPSIARIRTARSLSEY
jgi:ABC-type enterobactin transport system permease subunit